MIGRLALALLVAGCAPGVGPTGYPPARYDHPYSKAHMYLYRVNPYELAAICGNASGEKGCAIVGIGACSVYIRNDLSIKWTHQVRRHERGHCNGWPGAHPL